MSPKVGTSLVFLMLGYAPVVLAQHWNILDRLCIDPFVIRPVLEKPFRVPIGCEVIDCCPGCPGVGPLQIRFDVEGPMLERVELRFEGFDAARMRRLTISGNAKLEGDHILVRRGSSRVTGLPGGGGRFSIGTATPVIDRVAAQRLSRARTAGWREGDRDSDSARGSLAIRQYLGPYQVSFFRWRPYFSWCDRPPLPRSDQLKVQAIAQSDRVVAMLDSRTAPGGTGCTDDQVLRSTGVSFLSNRLASAGCNSEVAIFATANAMVFDSPVGTWTNSVGDVHASTLPAIINMPVSVWIANNAAAAQAVNDVANATLLYSTNKVGVQFNATFNNVSANAVAVTTIGTVSCGAIAAIQGSAFYTPNALNIYYVNAAFTGENCARTQPVGDGNISYMGTLANLASLAHEIGHAFGLRPAGSGGHTNAVAGFGNNNIMWGGGPATRDHFSLGQAFRMNTHTDQWGGTMLIADGLRPGPGRACPPLTTSTTCPGLVLDWARP